MAFQPSLLLFYLSSAFCTYISSSFVRTLHRFFHCPTRTIVFCYALLPSSLLLLCLCLPHFLYISLLRSLCPTIPLYTLPTFFSLPLLNVPLFAPFLDQMTCTVLLLVPILLTTNPLLSWQWSHFIFLGSIVSTGHIISSEDMELGASCKIEHVMLRHTQISTHYDKEELTNDDQIEILF